MRSAFDRRVLPEPVLALVVALVLAPCQAEEPNVADEYREAAALVDYPSPEPEELWEVLRDGWEGDHPELTAVLEMNRPALDRLRRIGEWRRCEFLPDTEVSLDTELPHLTPMRNLASVGALQARLDTSQGRLADAAAWELRIVRLAQGVANDRILISRLIESAILESALSGLVDIVRDPRCDAGTLCEVERVLAEYIALRRPCSRTIELERQMAIGILDRVFLTVPGLDVDSPPGKQSELTDAIRKGDLETRRQWRDKCESLLNDWYTRARVASAPGNHADLPTLPAEKRGLLDPPADPADQFFRMVAIGAARSVGVLARIEALVQGVRILAAVARYRTDTGEPPATIERLVPKYLPSVPNDPFDGKPIRYTAEGAGCRVWSVGPDLADDGGRKPYDPPTAVGPGTDVLLTMK